MKTYNEAMLDIETLSTEPDAVVLSAAVVLFNLNDHDTPETLEDASRCIHVILNAAEQPNRHISASTVLFWMGQDEAARKAIVNNQKAIAESTSNISNALSILVQTARRAQNLWGNGSDFDNVILKSILDDHDLKYPIRYSGNRCLRTLKAVARVGYNDVPWPESFIKHDALYDAKYQVLVAQHAWKQLYGQQT